MPNSYLDALLLLSYISSFRPTILINSSPRLINKSSEGSDLVNGFTINRQFAPVYYPSFVAKRHETLLLQESLFHLF